MAPPPTSVGELLAEADRIDGLHSLLVQRDGELVVEGYFDGADAERLFHLRSATKSVVGILVGIALDEGHLTSVDQTLAEILGKRVDRFGPDKVALTVRHLLSMRAGLRWDESTVDEYNRFRVARDPIGHYLGRRFVTAPGEKWEYSSGASHLLSIVLSEATGSTALEYARRALFEPLEIRNVRWERHNDGHTNGAAGLELRSGDSLKLGELMLGRGSWRGRRVVSEKWVVASTEGHPMITAEGSYGYQWWLEREPTVVWSALGFAGQVISVVPAENTVIVANCRWRGLGRPSAEQSTEVYRFIGDRLAPYLAPELFTETGSGSG